MTSLFTIETMNTLNIGLVIKAIWVPWLGGRVL